MTKSIFKNLIITLMCFLSSQNIFAQKPPVGYPVVPPIVSPEVHPDKTATFRFMAPNAKEVLLYTEIYEPKLMEKGTNGVWETTIGPIKPGDLYLYNFIVDGIKVDDPNNILIWENERFKYSLVDVPGDGPLVHDMQNVPHGIVSYRYYNSKTVGITRPLVVYTPPGYEQSQGKKYPVLYLIHGTTDTEETWFKGGRVNFILDNLIAQGKVTPMIVVMPYGNPTPISKFTDDLLNDVIPFVDTNYRTIANREQRAVAGFSRGGMQALDAGLLHSDVFAWVGGFAAPGNLEDYEKNFINKTPDPNLLNKNLKLYFMAIGTEDFLYQRVLSFEELLNKYNIKYESYVIPGKHTWMNVKNYMAKFAPKLFK